MGAEALDAVTLLPPITGTIAPRWRVLIGLAGNFSTVIVCFAWVLGRDFTTMATIDLVDAAKVFGFISAFVVPWGLLVLAFSAMLRERNRSGLE